MCEGLGTEDDVSTVDTKIAVTVDNQRVLVGISINCQRPA